MSEIIMYTKDKDRTYRLPLVASTINAVFIISCSSVKELSIFKEEVPSKLN